MNIASRLFNSFIRSVFRLLIILFISVTALLPLINETSLKKTLTEVNAYERFQNSVINSYINSLEQEQNTNFQSEQVEDTLRTTFPADDLQQKSETIIDSLFAWLNQSTSEPDFSISFQDNKKLFEDSFTQLVLKNLEALPVCQTFQNSIDPLTTDCQPQFYDKNEVEASIRQSLQNNLADIPDESITISTFNNSETNQPITEPFQDFPRYYSYMNSLPYFIGALVVVFGLAIIFQEKNRRSGTRRIGYGALSAGLFVVFSAIVFGVLLSPQNMNFIPEFNQASDVEQIVQDIFNTFSNNFNVLFITYGAISSIIGLLILLTEKLSRSKNPYQNTTKAIGLESSEQESLKNTSHEKQEHKHSHPNPLISSEYENIQHPSKAKKKKIS